MGGKSKIEWTDATWNPIVGCSIVSPGCITAASNINARFGGAFACPPRCARSATAGRGRPQDRGSAALGSGPCTSRP